MKMRLFHSFTRKSSFPEDLLNCCMKLITSNASSTKSSLFCGENTAFAMPCLEISYLDPFLTAFTVVMCHLHMKVFSAITDSFGPL